METPSQKISIVLTAHAEGDLALSAVGWIRHSIERLESIGVAVEVLVVLDRANSSTKKVFECAIPHLRLIETDFGDPGLARNKGIGLSTGQFLAVLDSDNFASENWLNECVNTMDRLGEGKWVLHPEIEIGFGHHAYVKRNIDQTSSEFDPYFLVRHNYWDTFCYARREIFIETPYSRLSPENKLGFEDWQWNLEVMTKGVVHRSVPKTIHFKRQKKHGSMNQLAVENNYLVLPSAYFDQIIESPQGKSEMSDVVDPRKQPWVVAECKRTCEWVKESPLEDSIENYKDVTPSTNPFLGRAYSLLFNSLELELDYLFLVSDPNCISVDDQLPRAIVDILAENPHARFVVVATDHDWKANAGAVSESFRLIDYSEFCRHLVFVEKCDVLTRVLFQKKPRRIHNLDSKVGQHVLENHSTSLQMNSKVTCDRPSIWNRLRSSADGLFKTGDLV